MLVLFLVGLVLVSANAVGLDAHRMQISTGRGPYAGASQAVTWAVGCALLWIVVFPLYLFQRARTLREHGGPSDSALVSWAGVVTIALAVIIIVTSSLGWERMSIEDLAAEVKDGIERDWRKSAATRRNRLASLQLTRVSRNDYAAAAVATSGNGKLETFNLAVTYDGRQVTWKALR